MPWSRRRAYRAAGPTGATEQEQRRQPL